MSDAMRGVPVTAEVNILEREIRGDDNLFPLGRSEQRAIVADAENQRRVLDLGKGSLTDACDQDPLAPGLLVWTLPLFAHAFCLSHIGHLRCVGDRGRHAVSILWERTERVFLACKLDAISL